MSRERSILPRVGSALVAMCACAGCVSSYSSNSLVAPTPLEEPVSSYRHYVLFGTIGHATRDVRDLCASARASRVEISANVLSVLAATASLGLYAPLRLHIYCEPTSSLGRSSKQEGDL